MNVRKISSLIIFFSITFIIIFAASTGIKFLSLRVDWIKNLPPKPETPLTLFLSAAHWALTLSIFSSIAITLNYAVRRNFFALTAIVCVILLSLFFCFGFSLALDQWKSVPARSMPLAQSSAFPLGDKGLILTNALNRNETAVVLLNGTAEPLGPRVTAIPGQPLVFQQTAIADFDFPSVLFGDDTPWFIKNLSIDIRLNAEMLQQKFSEGIFSYLFYAGSLIFLLCSLGYIIKFSAWPLANLFLAALAFRGILAFNTFFNNPGMQDVIGSFLNNLMPAAFALPLFFLGFGILVNLSSLLSFTAKRRFDDED